MNLEFPMANAACIYSIKISHKTYNNYDHHNDYSNHLGNSNNIFFSLLTTLIPIYRVHIFVRLY